MKSKIDTPLLRLTEQDHFTPRNAFEGVGIFGSIGSGKTTGSGQNLALPYLRSGFGGVVLCAKEEELSLWQSYCQKAGRTDDLVIVGKGSKHGFNFLDYEMQRQDSGAGITHNIASAFLTVMNAGEPEDDGVDKIFWNGTLRSLLIHTIDLCSIVRPKLSLRDIHLVIQTAPTKATDLDNPDWLKSSVCFRMMKEAADFINYITDPELAEKQYTKLRAVEDFFLHTWLDLSEKTRSIVNQMFVNFSGRFLSEPLLSCFCQKTTICPEHTLKGKIIVLNLPVLLYEQSGRDGQILFKYIWQRAMQRRKIDDDARPVFLWADEAHLFLHDYDVDFQSIARAFRACTVYISQNLPNYYLHAGAGDAGRNRIDALMGNLGTKIFHSNTCITTNQYASNTLGQVRGWKQNKGSSFGSDFSVSRGEDEHVDSVMYPAEFATLRTGGEANNFMTEAIIHKQGPAFLQTRTNYIRKYFPQNL